MNLATINLTVADPAACKAFYIDALGMTENTQRSEAPHFFYLESEGSALTLAKPHTGDAPKPAASAEIGFEVPDLVAAKQKLKAAGVKDFKEDSMGWGDAIETHDPSGHRVVIYALKQR